MLYISALFLCQVPLITQEAMNHSSPPPRTLKSQHLIGWQRRCDVIVTLWRHFGTSVNFQWQFLFQSKTWMDLDLAATWLDIQIDFCYWYLSLCLRLVYDFRLQVNFKSWNWIRIGLSWILRLCWMFNFRLSLIWIKIDSTWNELLT